MFGLGLSEILVIAIIALLFVGPDKLPGAAKSIGKGIRDLRKTTRDLRETLEKDTQLGDAVREIRSALQDDPRHHIPRQFTAPLLAAESEIKSAIQSETKAEAIETGPATEPAQPEPKDDREPA